MSKIRLVAKKVSKLSHESLLPSGIGLTKFCSLSYSPLRRDSWQSLLTFLAVLVTSIKIL